jgi:hypothetical protein
MQNTVIRPDESGKDTEVVIFSEYTDHSGFWIREVTESKDPRFRFQAGYIVMTPMRLPVYKGAVVTHHVDGDEIQRFQIHGAGSTKAEALEQACNKLLRAEIAKTKH